MQKPGRLDIYSLIFGVLLSLIAQGIWNVAFDWTTGHVLDEFVELSLLFIVAAILLNIFVFYFFMRLKNNPEDLVNLSKTKDKPKKKGIFNRRLFDPILLIIIFSLVALIVILIFYNYLKFPELQDPQTLNIFLTVALVFFGLIEAISTITKGITEKKRRKAIDLRNELEKFYSPLISFLNGVVYVEEGNVVLNQEDKKTLDSMFSQEPSLLDSQQEWKMHFHRQEIPDIDVGFVKRFNDEFERKRGNEKIEQRFSLVYSKFKNATQNVDKVALVFPDQKKMLDKKFLTYPYMVGPELYDYWNINIRTLKPTIRNNLRYILKLQENLKNPKDNSDEIGIYLVPEVFILEFFKEYEKRASKYREI